jgi:hypothetical protein
MFESIEGGFRTILKLFSEHFPSQQSLMLKIQPKQLLGSRVIEL